MSLAAIYRAEHGRILATLVRQLGDIDLAEEALQEAWAAALTGWSGGAPESPRAWLLSTARHKAIDRVRRDVSLRGKRDELERHIIAEQTREEGEVPTDRLRLIFTCCHPALSMEAQVALTLRTLLGLTVEEIARAFLVPAVTMAQRLVRAKNKIRGARIPYVVPEGDLMPERLEGVLVVIYLVFNEGYSASHGAALLRRELCAEAIRLGRMLVELLPARTEPRALLALMLLHDARRDTRAGPDGELVLLDAQDRSRWDRDEIAEGAALVAGALRDGPPTPYAVQAAIAALHGQATRAEDTDWPQIAVLYRILLGLSPSPVIALNHAAAVAMAQGPEAGLALMASLEAGGELAGYYLLPAAQADLLRRLGRHGEAAAAYRRALALVGTDPERRFLEGRLAEVSQTDD